jgi:hypothetical protein
MFHYIFIRSRRPAHRISDRSETRSRCGEGPCISGRSICTHTACACILLLLAKPEQGGGVGLHTAQYNTAYCPESLTSFTARSFMISLDSSGMYLFVHSAEGSRLILPHTSARLTTK